MKVKDLIISKIEIAEKSGFTKQTKEEILEESKFLLNRNYKYNET